MRVDELRSELQHQAEVVGSGGVHERMRSVHRRVDRARRRRTAGVAVVAVVAVGLAVVPPLTAHHPPQPAHQNAPAKLAGRTVPTTQTATGFGFDYVRGLESRRGQKRLTVRLRDSDQPRLVMWASSDTGRRPTVTVTDVYGAAEKSPAGDFDRYLFVPAGSDTVVLTQADAGPRTRLALATYALSRTPPPGVTNGEVTYRDPVLGSRLLTGRLGTRGQTDLTLQVTIPVDGEVWLSDLCYGSPHSYRVTLGRRVLVGGPCEQQPPFDPATSARITVPLGRPGETVALRVHLDPRAGGRGEVTDPGVVLGLAAYADQTPMVSVAGTQVPQRVEDGGHEYAASEWSTTDPGSGRLRMGMNASDTPRLVTVVTHGLAVSSKVVLLADGRRVLWQEEDGNGTSQNASDYVIQPGDKPALVLRVERGMTPRAQVGVVFSDLVH